MAEAYDTLGEVKVRDYVPVLIEKRAKEALHTLKVQPGTASTG